MTVAALPPFRVGMIALESVTRQLALIAQAEALAAAQAAQSKDAAAQSAINAANSANTAASATNAAVNIYVDLLSTAGAAANGSTWALAYNNLLTAL